MTHRVSLVNSLTVPEHPPGRLILDNRKAAA